MSDYQIRYKDSEILKVPAESFYVVGAGAVGSAIVRNLAGLHHNIVVMDGDRVESENCIPQQFPVAAIGSSKAVQLRDIVRSMGCQNVKAYSEYIDTSYASSFNDRIIISAVDSMEARAMLFEMWKTSSSTLFIDTRMAGEVFTIYFVEKSDFAWYEETLYSDEEAFNEPCTNKATPFTPSIIGGVAVQNICNLLINKSHGLPVRNAYKRIDYNGLTFKFNFHETN